MKTLNLSILFAFFTSQLFGQMLWSIKPSFPGSARETAVGFSVSGKGYIGLGRSPGQTIKDDFWQFDPVSDSWSQVASFPGGPTYGSFSFVINNIAYVGTGWHAVGATKACYKYDQFTNLWSQVADFPGYASYSNVAAVVNGKAYAGIGYAPYNNQWFEYDPLSDSWTQKTSFPGAMRQAGTAFTLNNNIYVGLGVQALTSTNFQSYDDFYIYNPDSDLWNIMPPFPGGARYGVPSFVIGNKAYLVGGFNYSVYNNEVWSFDGLTSAWTQLPNYPGMPQYASAAFVIGNSAYVGTGSGGTYYTDFYKFSSNEDKLISGKIFYDDNNNQVWDNGELPVSYTIVHADPGNEYVSSGIDGSFQIAASSGIYTVDVPNPPLYYSISPVVDTVDMTVNFTDTTVLFACHAATPVQDLKISLTPVNTIRGGGYDFINVTYKNAGTSAVTDSIYFSYDTLLTFVQTIPAQPGLNSGINELQIPFSYLLPGETRTFSVMLLGANTIQMDDTLYCHAAIYPVIADSVPADNYATTEQIAVGSFDPNDISVNFQTLTPTQVADGIYLDYIIRFQNTGTAEAINIRVADVLPQEVDVASLEMISASHNYTMNLQQDGTLTWFFDNIMLADSNTNEAESHGFIRYRIKPKNNLTVGQSIENSAAIYFDFNSPVITNTAITTIYVTGINEMNSSGMMLYPNPFTDLFTIKSDEAITTIRIMDVTGSTVKEFSNKQSGTLIRVDTSELNTGIYIIQVSSADKVKSGKLIKL